MRYATTLFVTSSVLAAVNLANGPLALLGWACLAITAITSMSALIAATARPSNSESRPGITTTN